MSTNPLAVLNNIEMNASVSLDDIVNVFISRFETERHGRFEDLQANLKDNAAKLKALDLEAIERVKADFVRPDEVIHRGLMFEVVQSFGKIDLLWPSNEVSFEIKQVNKVINHAKLVDYYNKTESTHTFVVKVNLNEDLVAARACLVEQGTTLRDELMAVNQQLQQVDRKSRQVKGFIAERKLEQAGMTALLQNPELAKLIEMN